MPYSSAYFCNSQEPDLSQVVHSLSWFASNSSKTSFLILRVEAVFKCTLIPASGGIVQEELIIFLPFGYSTSTTHILQAPNDVKSGR